MHNGVLELHLREVLQLAADRAVVRPGAARDVIRRSQPVRMGIPVGMAAVALGLAFAGAAVLGLTEGQGPAGFGKKDDGSGPVVQETPEATPTQTPTPQLSPSPEPENPPWELIDSGMISTEPWKLMYFPSLGEDLCPEFGLGYNNWYGAGGFMCPTKIDHLMVVQASFENFPEVAPVYGIVSKEAVSVTITLEGSDKGEEAIPARIYSGPEGFKFDYFLGFLPSVFEHGHVVAQKGNGEVVKDLDLCMADSLRVDDPMGMCQKGADYSDQ